MGVTPTLEGWRFAKEHGFGAVAEFGFWVENIDELPGSGLAGPHVVLDRLRPVASHLGAAVAYASVADVDTVIVDGILRKSGGDLVDVDRAALVGDAEASRDRLLPQIGTSTEQLRFSGQIGVQQQ